MLALPFLQEGCGRNYICKATVAVDSFFTDVFSFFDTVFDNILPLIIIIMLVSATFVVLRVWRGGTSWQGMADLLLRDYLAVAIVVVVGLGAIFALLSVYTELFDQIGLSAQDFVR